MIKCVLKNIAFAALLIAFLLLLMVAASVAYDSLNIKVMGALQLLAIGGLLIMAFPKVSLSIIFGIAILRGLAEGHAEKKGKPEDQTPGSKSE
jgi:hypothetical protein